MAVMRKRLRHSIKEAVELLDIGVSTFRRYMAAGEFTVVRDRPGSTRGAPAYIPADEIEAFALGGLEGLREFRTRARRVKQ